MSADGLDQRLADARSRMVDAGFEVIDERGPEAFGNRLIELHRGLMRARLTRDRDQLFLVMAADGWETSHDIGLWEACLEDALPSLEPRPMETELNILLTRLDQFERVLDGGPELDECLREAGMWRFTERRRRGFIRPPS